VTGTGAQPAVDIRREGAVSTITLSRPERRNAIDAQLQTELVAALQEFDAAPEARVAVLTGADPAFCAGMDLRELGRGAMGHDDGATNYAEAMRAVGKPVIGAINGPAVAGGFELALACDFLIASDRAWFADSHAEVGVVPGGGLTVHLAQAVGVRRARQISLSGEYVSAERAFHDGLVTEVVPHEQLLPRAAEIAAAVAARDERIVAALRDAYDRALNLPAQEALDAEAAASRAAGISASHVHDVAGGLIARGSATTSEEQA
jgi:enoyl-CoA hydratase